jgi:hypothetical protein
MRRRVLRWIMGGCLVLAVAGVGLYFLAGYLLISQIEKSLKPLPATQILHSVARVSIPSDKPLPSPQTLFEAADSALTSMERLDIRLNIHECSSPLWIALMTAPSPIRRQSNFVPETIPPNSPQVIRTDISNFPSVSASIQLEWHIDFGKKLVLFRRIQDDTTKRTPYEFRHKLSSEPTKEAAYDGDRWVFIYDEQRFHPRYIPERAWRYDVVILGNYEEGREILGAHGQDLLALFGLHRAYLFAENNMRSLLEFDKLLLPLDVPKGWKLITEGVDKIGPYQCYRVKAINHEKQSTVWLWFCPDLQYRCIRAEYTDSGSVRLIKDNQPTPANAAAVVEILEWTQGGFKVPMPKKMRYAFYIPASPSEYILFQQKEIRVHYLPPVEDSAYRLSIPAESAYVSDNIANQVYTLGKQVPIAPRRFPWWLLGVLVGFLLVLGGVGVRFYRRRRAVLNG